MIDRVSKKQCSINTFEYKKFSFKLTEQLFKGLEYFKALFSLYLRFIDLIYKEKL